MPFDPVCRWQKSPSANVNQYAVQWSLNGAPSPVNTPAIVPQSTVGDTAGYGTDFAAVNPAVVLKSGDVVDCTIIATDTVANLSSSPVTPPSLTMPLSPPAPPANVTLALA